MTTSVSGFAQGTHRWGFGQRLVDGGALLGAIHIGIDGDLNTCGARTPRGHITDDMFWGVKRTGRTSGRGGGGGGKTLMLLH